MEDQYTTELMTTGQLATFLQVSESTLARWRLYGCGPHFLKLGRRVLYRREEVEEFFKHREYRSTSHATRERYVWDKDPSVDGGQ